MTTSATMKQLGILKVDSRRRVNLGKHAKDVVYFDVHPKKDGRIILKPHYRMTKDEAAQMKVVLRQLRQAVKEYKHSLQKPSR